MLFVQVRWLCLKNQQNMKLSAQAGSNNVFLLFPWLHARAQLPHGSRYPNVLYYLSVIIFATNAFGLFLTVAPPLLKEKQLCFLVFICEATSVLLMAAELSRAYLT